MNITKPKIKRASKKRSSMRFPNFKNTFLGTGIGLLLLGLFWISDTLTAVRLPSSNEPAEFYANQLQDDLRNTTLAAIKEAKQSILLIIYSLTDDGVITCLREKSIEGVDVRVICDAKASPNVVSRLGSKVNVIRRMTIGLMHQKILVIDEAKVWIGSANMTGESLRFHGNLIAAMHCPEMAAHIKAKAQTMNEYDQGPCFPHREFSIGGQKVELWFFPDDKHGVQRLVELIRTAKKTIRVAMFTWTRSDLAKEIIAAKQRGIDTQVVIDNQQGKGAGAAIVKQLFKAGVPVGLSQGSALLHHKFLYIDGEILVNGSANWTKAAFTKNDDCFIIIQNLTKKQKMHLDGLWKVISSESQMQNKAPRT